MPDVRGRVLRGCVALLVATMAVAACSDDGGSGSSTSSRASGSSTKSVPLLATDWVLTDATTLQAAPDTAVTAHFANGTVAGNGGCNQYRAPYRLDGPQLAIGSEIAGTRTACPSGPTAVEHAYLERLPRVREYSIVDDLLKLADRDGKVILTYEPAASTGSLLGGWEVTGYYTGTAIESPTGPAPTANFAASTVTGFGGCNRFNGPYSTQRDAITIGPFASTLVACADPDRSTQEQQYLHALELARTFSVTGDRLDLVRQDGGLAVTLQRPGASR